MSRTAHPLALPAGLLLGYALDEIIADPRRGHPVALFGWAAAALERAMWRDDRSRGVAYVALAVGVPTLAAGRLDRRLNGPLAHAALVATLTWVALGGRSLRAEAEAMAKLLQAEDLSGARRRLGHLCSRDATNLPADEIARAAVESIAENTADAVIGPLLWGALAGPAGVVAYRCANTLDAMFGYRSARYERFGWASARLDDALNVLPARLTAALTVALAPALGGSRAEAWAAWRDDAPAHPSPNAGVVEATAAGALGVRLGGANTYQGQIQDRGVLGCGRAVDVADLRRVARLANLLSLAGLAGCLALATAIQRCIR
ncbi:MAG: cobalamin biosynthesis protein [Micrococcales bacterium]|nr:cobalamin biosynthesis protein [Micrococcales bacterium]